ncbi:MAG: alpha-rhamnosidase [Prevotella sp.]|nr:alpha-rhamnosidase [Prevotella sp.]
MQERNKATWIWYPGDFEIWLGNIFNNRRTERGAMFPPFWKQDSHYVTVEFTKEVELAREEVIVIRTEGKYNLSLDGKLQYGMPQHFSIPAGKHRLSFKVWNQATPPALFISGLTRQINSDASWLVTYEDKIWIDENGVAHGSGIYVPAGYWDFDDIQRLPSEFKLPTEWQDPVSKQSCNGGMLYDFGRETFGYLNITGVSGTGALCICYGESSEEALDKEHCETFNQFNTVDGGNRICKMESKAFRYVYIETAGETRYDSVGMYYEYAPYKHEQSGSFRSNDKLLNRIWDTAAYTMDLTTREFFVDGIKRDRWTWSGDAIQSYLMNYYLRFDSQCVKRTIRQLRGKDPVTAHINTIMDYTFYWFKSISDYYDYTADLDFVRELYPRMQTLMQYVLSRTNADGWAEGQPDDWIFVDWVDFPMHKRGTLCFEQLLFCKSLETMQRFAELLGKEPTTYKTLADRLRQQIHTTFWDESKQAYLHAIEDGQINAQITKFPNMFAILYGYTDESQSRHIMEHVLLNPDVPPITTPYMRFYEMEALCQLGQQEQVLKQMRSYWGGMLHEGATTFWEKYNPEEKGAQHLAMYGRPYGKSLCHAWGASPIYLLGRYFLGVRPLMPGYREFEVQPQLGGLKQMEGSVPTPDGLIHVSVKQHSVTVRNETPHSGWLSIGCLRYAIEGNDTLTVEY